MLVLKLKYVSKMDPRTPAVMILTVQDKLVFVFYKAGFQPIVRSRIWEISQISNIYTY